MGSTWDKIDKLHLFYRKGPIFYYPSKQPAALPCENTGLNITEMTLLKAEEKNGFSYMNRIFRCFSICAALLSELFYQKLRLNVLSEQLCKIIFRRFSGKEIAPFQQPWQGVTVLF